MPRSYEEYVLESVTRGSRYPRIRGILLCVETAENVRGLGVRRLPGAG